jgi:hypothetical protein
MRQTETRGASAGNGHTQGLVDNLRDIVALASGLADDVRRLVQQELLLARQRLREMIVANLLAAGLLLAAAAVLFAGLILAVVTILFFVPPPARPWTALGVTLFLFVAAGVTAIVGKSMIRTDVRDLVSGLKEDLEWARQQAKPSGN